jgi:hypothetical protein
MDNITMITTGCTPAVGMPGHGSALRTTGVVWAARGRVAGQPTAALAVAGTAVPAAAKDVFPGTDAWSPPRR